MEEQLRFELDASNFTDADSANGPGIQARVAPCPRGQFGHTFWSTNPRKYRAT